MPISKRNPVNKVLRDVKAKYIKSLRKKLLLAKAAEKQAGERVFTKGNSLSEWDNSYRVRKDIQRQIEFISKKRKK